MNILGKHYLTMALLLAASGFSAAVAQEQPEPPDMMEIAEKEADRLQRLLRLDDWQVFYVDSTLKHDFPAMQDELKALQDAKVSNSSMYIAVQDKWMEQIDKAYKEIFNEEQWNTYLKAGGAAKQQKAREKRKQKAIEAEARLKEKLGK